MDGRVLKEVRTALNRKIEEQAQEIARLKRNQKAVKYLSFGKLSIKYERGSQRRKPRADGSSSISNVTTVNTHNGDSGGESDEGGGKHSSYVNASHNVVSI